MAFFLFWASRKLKTIPLCTRTLTVIICVRVCVCVGKRIFFSMHTGDILFILLSHMYNNIFVRMAAAKKMFNELHQITSCEERAVYFIGGECAMTSSFFARLEYILNLFSYIRFCDFIYFFA